jgi:hypothetical protein
MITASTNLNAYTAIPHSIASEYVGPRQCRFIGSKYCLVAAEPYFPFDDGLGIPKIHAERDVTRPMAGNSKVVCVLEIPHVGNSKAHLVLMDNKCWSPILMKKIERHLRLALV